MKKNIRMRKINKENLSVKMIEDALLAASNLCFYEAKNKIVQALINAEINPDKFARRLVSYETCPCCGQIKSGTERYQYYMVLRTRRGENILTPLTLKQRGELPVFDIVIGFGDVKNNYDLWNAMDYAFPYYDWCFQEKPIVELEELSFDNRRKPALSKKKVEQIAALTEELLSVLSD